MESVQLLAQAMPLTVSAAVLAYIAVGGALVSGPVRGWFRRHLVMPNPSNQSHLGSLDALRGLAAVWVVSFHSCSGGPRHAQRSVRIDVCPGW